MRRFALVLLTAALPLPALRAQLEFSELLFDPAGLDRGRQIVELVNPTGAAFTPTGWQLCAPFIYAPLPSIAVPAGGVVQIHLGASGNDNATDWYMPLMRTLTRRDTLLLYKSANFNLDADIIDFVSWGGGTGRIDQAVRVGLWPSLTATVPAPPSAHTIAWTGIGNAPSAWYGDATPTLGAPNGVGTVANLGQGCPTSLTVPTLLAPSAAVDGNIDFRLFALPGLPGQGAVFLVGTTPGGGVPVLGCPIEAVPVLAPPTTVDSAGIAQVSLPLIANVSLIGLTLYAQALIADAGSPNGLFGATAGLQIVVG